MSRADPGVEEVTEHPRMTRGGPSMPEIVEHAESGDRIHVKFPTRDGDVQWRSYWATDAGDDYVQIGSSKRIVVADADRYEGIELHEEIQGEYECASWTETACGIERIPAEVFEEQTVYNWEIMVSEARSGEISTDQSVFPDAPTKEEAFKKAKRWAGLGSSSHVRVHYNEGEVESR